MVFSRWAAGFVILGNGTVTLKGKSGPRPSPWPNQGTVRFHSVGRSPGYPGSRSPTDSAYSKRKSFCRQASYSTKATELARFRERRPGSMGIR